MNIAHELIVSTDCTHSLDGDGTHYCTHVGVNPIRDCHRRYCDSSRVQSAPRAGFKLFRNSRRAFRTHLHARLKLNNDCAKLGFLSSGSLLRGGIM